MSVCVSLSVCVCVFVCLGLTFEPVDIETSFLVWWYIVTTSMSSLSIKVIGSSQGHLIENANFATWTSYLTWFDLSEVKVINVIKSYQGQCHSKVKL